MEPTDFSVDQWRAIGEGEVKDGCIPHFYMRPVQDAAASEREGRPIFVEQEFVTVLIPGDKNTRPDMAVEDSHREKWPIAYGRFKQGKEQVDGTPLREWAFLSRTQLAELEALGMQTIEQVAGMQEQVRHQLGPHAEMFESRAREFLLGDDEVVKKLRGDNIEMENKLEAMQAQIESLTAQIAETQAGGDELEDDKPKPRRGRPPKVEVN